MAVIPGITESITGASSTAVIVTVISCVSVNPTESVKINVTTSKPEASNSGVTVRTSVTGSIEAVNRVSSTSEIDQVRLLSSPAGPSSASVS